MRARILFVEDQPEYFAPFIEALQKSYELEQAEDLTAAVEVLSVQEFDLLIIDIMLPKGTREFPGIDDRRSGLHLIRLIRGEVGDEGVKLKCQAQIPILAITAVSDSSAHRALEAVRVKRIAKPFSMSEVVEIIGTMLKGRADVPE